MKQTPQLFILSRFTLVPGQGPPTAAALVGGQRTDGKSDIRMGHIIEKDSILEQDIADRGAEPEQRLFQGILAMFLIIEGECFPESVEDTRAKIRMLFIKTGILEPVGGESTGRLKPGSARS